MVFSIFPSKIFLWLRRKSEKVFRNFGNPGRSAGWQAGAQSIFSLRRKSEYLFRNFVRGELSPGWNFSGAFSPLSCEPIHSGGQSNRTLRLQGRQSGQKPDEGQKGLRKPQKSENIFQNFQLKTDPVLSIHQDIHLANTPGGGKTSRGCREIGKSFSELWVTRRHLPPRLPWSPRH